MKKKHLLWGIAPSTGNKNKKGKRRRSSLKLENQMTINGVDLKNEIVNTAIKKDGSFWEIIEEKLIIHPETPKY